MQFAKLPMGEELHEIRAPIPAGVRRSLLFTHLCFDRASQDYPVRTVTIIVPFAPGGSTDTLAQVLAPKLGQRLGKPFVVENRPGDGTVSAASMLAKAARWVHPDAGDERHLGDECCDL